MLKASSCFIAFYLSRTSYINHSIMNMQYGIIVLIVLGIVQFVNGLYKKQPNIVVIMGDDMVNI